MPKGHQIKLLKQHLNDRTSLKIRTIYPLQKYFFLTSKKILFKGLLKYFEVYK